MPDAEEVEAAVEEVVDEVAAKAEAAQAEFEADPEGAIEEVKQNAEAQAAEAEAA